MKSTGHKNPLRARNVALGFALLAFVVLVYLVTLVKMSGG